MFFRRPLAWLVVLLPTLAFAGPGTQPPQTRPAGSGEVVLDPATAGEEPFEHVFRSIRIDGLTLDEALDHVREATRANIVLDSRVLEVAGVDLMRTAKIRLWDVSLDQVLRILLPLYSRELDLRWERRDNIIFISTAEGILSTTTKMYDVRLLIDLVQASYVALDTPVYRMRTSEESVEEIIRVMQEMVDPDSWRDNGGVAGAVRELGGRLVVTQTRANHRLLDAFLKELETEYSRPQPVPTTRSTTLEKPAEPAAR